MGAESNAITITEAYRNYEPPVNVARAVRQMIDATPSKYLAGLRTIVLTNAGGLNHRRRRAKTLSRKRRVAIRDCRGLYHQKWNAEPAWIEIFVDNLFKIWPKWLLCIPVVRDLAIADILFHEIGHHVHYTKVPEHREREDVADRWQGRLLRHYIRTRHRYMYPLLVAVAKLVRLVAPSRLLQQNST